MELSAKSQIFDRNCSAPVFWGTRLLLGEAAAAKAGLSAAFTVVTSSCLAVESACIRESDVM